MFTFLYLNTQMVEQKRIIEELKSGKPEVIQQVYSEHRTRCLVFLESLGLPSDQAEDVYQDAIIALVENARKGKIDQLKCALSTYLFAIAKFMAFSVFTASKRRSEVYRAAVEEHEAILDTYEFEWQNFREEAEQPEVILLRHLIGKLGGKCKTILHMAYVEGLSADAIASRLGYLNKDVLKSQKSRCLRQLRNLFNKHKDDGTIRPD